MIKSVARQGIIVGIISSLYIALLYTAGVEVFANWWYSVIIMHCISIGLICYFTKQLRDKNETEPFQFNQTFVVLLTMFMLSTLVSTIWNIILFNVIDTALAKELSVRIIEETMETMEKWEVPADAIAKTKKDMRDLPEQFKPVAQLIDWLKVGIFMAIVILICAAFIKRKEPVNPFTKNE